MTSGGIGNGGGAPLFRGLSVRRHRLGRLLRCATDDGANRIPAERHRRQHRGREHPGEPGADAAEPLAPVVRNEGTPQAGGAGGFTSRRIHGQAEPDRDEGNDAGKEHHPLAVGG